MNSHFPRSGRPAPREVALYFPAWHRKRARERWQYATRDAGLAGKGYRMHGLRHSFASALLERGASIRALQAALGHATASETLNTYSHLMPDSADNLRSLMDAA